MQKHSDLKKNAYGDYWEKKMSFDLSKLIDRLEPYFEDSSGICSKYYGNVTETIEEKEDDLDPQHGLVSPEIFMKLKA